MKLLPCPICSTTSLTPVLFATELEVPVDIVFAQESFQHLLHFKIACAHEGFVVDRLQPMTRQTFNPHDYRDTDINDDDDDFEDMDGDDEDDGLIFENLSDPIQTAIENFLEDYGITDELSADTHTCASPRIHMQIYL